MGVLERLGDHLWFYDGGDVNFYGFAFPTRTTIARLENGSLWVHSPSQLDSQVKAEIDAIGPVEYLIAPNKLHHLFIQQWTEAFPEARTFAPPGLRKKRSDLTFDRELGDEPDTAWAGEIGQMIFRGSRVMEEVVFFHVPSRTLILTDLVENFDPNRLGWWQRGLARMAGVLYPNGKTPLDWRLTFLVGNRKQARHSLSRMLSWEIDKVIMAHGVPVMEDAPAFLRRSFAWIGQ